jgi:putative acetyltransferase
MDSVRELFREYAEVVGSPICFESFAREMAELPGQYSPLLLALVSDQPAGCAALRKIGDGIGEMKRLYIRPAFQGGGLGRLLAESIIAEATAAGFHLLRLDTLPVMESAIRLYRKLGFHEIPPYGDNPPEAICLELKLQSSRSLRSTTNSVSNAGCIRIVETHVGAAFIKAQQITQLAIPGAGFPGIMPQRLR